jgi:hypothetical protein
MQSEGGLAVENERRRLGFDERTTLRAIDVSTSAFKVEEGQTRTETLNFSV